MKTLLYIRARSSNILGPAGILFAVLAHLSLFQVSAATDSGSIGTDVKPSFETRLFELDAVRLLEGPFEKAAEANRDYLLALDPDRLLAPFLREAGLEPRKPSYGNWENSGLDGHTAGHYLSALALMVASGHDTVGHELDRRLDTMLEELERCQIAGADGYIGGVPDGNKLWAIIRAGEIDAHGFGINGAWVPWYNVHKTFAGLRDAYVLGKKTKALSLLTGLGDWCVDLLGNLDEPQMQRMLQSEHGGMNEVLADLYALTGDSKYLKAAERFCHHEVLEPLKHHEDLLTGMHANTQIPKVIGLARIGELEGNDADIEGARFFWETVTRNRSVAFGGNSVREHFNDPKDFSEVVKSRQGPETCNTYNMLRLTEKLFTAEPEARYADYYERALFNHILASINPETPGYVYFTPLRPQHYRVYSQPESCFWCCVGSGMENPGKYGEFIYAKSPDGGLYVNLFVASEVAVADGIRLIQHTAFPFESNTRLNLEMANASTFTLRIRRPWWATGEGWTLRVNGESVASSAEPSSYAELTREWKDGDVIEVDMPMHLSVEPLPDASDWVSLLYGPILLAAPAGEHDLVGLRADDSRMGHVADGPMVALDEVTTLIDNGHTLSEQLTRDPAEGPMAFRLKTQTTPSAPEGILLKPFFTLHDQRYQMIWEYLSQAALDVKRDALAAEEAAIAAREAATIDHVAIGEQQSEVEHDFAGVHSETGIFDGKRWRHGESFQYTLDTRSEQALELELTYWGGDKGRVYDILVNGVVIGTQEVPSEQEAVFYQKRYPIFQSLLKEAKEGRVTVTFLAKQGLAGGIYGVRLMRPATNPAGGLACNPVIWADVPDISIIRVGDTYYMSSTTMHMSPGLPIMKSKDLVTWETLRYGYDILVDNEKLRLENGENAYGAGSWASSLRYHDGVYYVTTFASTSEKTHVYSTTDIEQGPWDVFSFEPKLHDHSLWFEDDGRVYMLYGGGEIKMVELNPGAKGIKPGTETKVLIPNASIVAGENIGLPAEGSQLFQVNGRYYLFNITWPREDMRTVVVHRADSLEGPWEGKVVFKDRGIAQGGLIDTPNGDWYAYLFQDHGAVGRIPFLIPVSWEDGWPVLGENGKAPETLPIPAAKDRLGEIVASDEFERGAGEASLPLAWQWNHNPVNDAWSVSERPGYLRLQTFRKDSNVLQSRNILTQRTFGPICSAETEMDFTGMKVGDTAGLIALQKQYGFIGVKRDAEGYHLVVEQVENDVSSETASILLAPENNRIFLRISCDFRGVWPQFADLATFHYSLNGENWMPAGQSLHMKYTLPHFMGYRFGLFNFAKETTGGRVDFDYYRIAPEL